MALLLLAAGGAAAQTTTGNPINNIPGQVTTSAENRAVAKTSTVSNQAMDKLDSASNRAFRGFTHMFKKKDKNKSSGKDSTATHRTDTTTVPKTTSQTCPRVHPDFLTPIQRGLRADLWAMADDTASKHLLYSKTFPVIV
jgi:hypothetical protein